MSFVFGEVVDWVVDGANIVIRTTESNAWAAFIRSILLEAEGA